jgi:hypothetical protein
MIKSEKTPELGEPVYLPQTLLKQNNVSIVFIFKHILPKKYSGK